MNFGKMLSYTRQFHLADIWDRMDMYYNVRKLKLDWWKSTNQTDKMAHIQTESDNLTLKHIAGAFYVLIACLVICSAVFIQECLTYLKRAILKSCLKVCLRLENAIIVDSDRDVVSRW